MHKVHRELVAILPPVNCSAGISLNKGIGLQLVMTGTALNILDVRCIE